MWQWGTESQENSSSSVCVNLGIFVLDNFCRNGSPGCACLRWVFWSFLRYCEPNIARLPPPSSSILWVLSSSRRQLPCKLISPQRAVSCPRSLYCLCSSKHHRTGRSGIPPLKNWIALQATLSFLGELAFPSTSGRTLHKTLHSWHFVVVVVVRKELFLSILMIFSDFLWALCSWQLQTSVYRQ